MEYDNDQTKSKVTHSSALLMATLATATFGAESQQQGDNFNNLGFFLQDEWQINDRLEIVLGLRIDKANTLNNWVFSPRTAARYTASNTVTLRANISSGFLAPRAPSS